MESRKSWRIPGRPPSHINYADIIKECFKKLPKNQLRFPKTIAKICNVDYKTVVKYANAFANGGVSVNGFVKVMSVDGHQAIYRDPPGDVLDQDCIDLATRTIKAEHGSIKGRLDDISILAAVCEYQKNK